MRNRATTPLKKAKIRMSMSKLNLYNLSRLPLPPYRSRTFYQQKWSAKSVCRDYHGEQVREGQWSRMFSRRLRSVVPMEPAYLASNDGSSESAGRGSGLESREGRKPPEATPYMNMTFAPLERRLDVSIFRALFASSARQARQFVVHGAVKVNGQTMRYPGYLLNPGDMFQVEPERVMYAMGVSKPSTRPAAARGAENEEPEETEGAEEVQAPRETPPEIGIDRSPKEILKDLQAQAKSILSSASGDLGGKRKQHLRAFAQTIRKMMSRAGKGTVLTDNLEAQFEELKNQLKLQPEAKDSGKPLGPSQQADAEDLTPADAADLDANYVSDQEYNELLDALSHLQTSPTNEDKPYATKWMPREYMSAFAFIPRYLEVNQNICAGVYLRHPVARPGLAEVPTPYPETTNASAFAWYLRRR